MDNVKPFDRIGIDTFGSIDIKYNRKAEHVHVLLITCMFTRAIHLEVIKNCTVESLLLAFEKFISRRGVPVYVISDNAKSFLTLCKEVTRKYCVEW